MKTKDIQVGVQYLVLAPWNYNQASHRKPDEVPSNARYATVTFTSLEKYAYESHYSTSDTAPWAKHDSTQSKVYGFLAYDSSSSRWFIAKPQDVVGELAVIQQRWNSQAEAKRIRDEALRVAQEQQALRKRTLIASAETDIEGIKQMLQAELRGRADLSSVEYQNRYYAGNDNHAPLITLRLSDMVLFVEKYMEIKDQL